MMNAAVRDSSVGGCANAAKEAKGRKVPSDRWCASMLKSVDTDCLQEGLENSIRDQIRIFKRHGKIPKKGMTVAVDMHLIPRYDKMAGEELTRSDRSK